MTLKGSPAFEAKGSLVTNLRPSHHFISLTKSSNFHYMYSQNMGVKSMGVNGEPQSFLMVADPAVSQSLVDFVLAMAPLWHDSSRLTVTAATWTW